MSVHSILLLGIIHGYSVYCQDIPSYKAPYKTYFGWPEKCSKMSKLENEYWSCQEKFQTKWNVHYNNYVCIDNKNFHKKNQISFSSLTVYQ